MRDKNVLELRLAGDHRRIEADLREPILAVVIAPEVARAGEVRRLAHEQTAERLPLAVIADSVLAQPR